jgi:hypothetical protein
MRPADPSQPTGLDMGKPSDEAVKALFGFGNPATAISSWPGQF